MQIQISQSLVRKLFSGCSRLNLEFYGSHPIYDACLFNPESLEFPYIKGSYYEGGFETNCSYNIEYFSDKHCRNKINSSYTYNEQCRESTDGVPSYVPYSYDFPDCPWRPNTVWVVVFCVLGCCYFGYDQLTCHISDIFKCQ